MFSEWLLQPPRAKLTALICIEWYELIIIMKSKLSCEGQKVHFGSDVAIHVRGGGLP